jgi:hypothetical protein
MIVAYINSHRKLKIHSELNKELNNEFNCEQINKNMNERIILPKIKNESNNNLTLFPIPTTSSKIIDSVKINQLKMSPTKINPIKLEPIRLYNNSL